MKVQADVDCLFVSGNLARIGGTIARSDSSFFAPGERLTFEVQDNDQVAGGLPDAFSFGQTEDCQAVAGSFGELAKGNFVVHDAG